jgi:hypothetical protein
MIGSRMASLAKMAFFPTLLLVVAAALGVLAGCSSRSGGGGNDPTLGGLQRVYDLIQRAAASLGRPPSRLEDLSRYKASYPLGYKVVKSGKIEVRWGTKLKDEGESGKDEEVLAYEKDASTQGGYVLLSAGTIKKMSASEFQAALNRK